jgi:hypothetical protein
MADRHWQWDLRFWTLALRSRYVIAGFHQQGLVFLTVGFELCLSKLEALEKQFGVVALVERQKRPFAAIAFGQLGQMAQRHVEHWTFRNGKNFKMSKT